MKYTKEFLEQHVPHVKSNAELARRLGIAPTGSNTTNLGRRCKQHGIDTSHFTGQVHSKGKPARNRLAPAVFLVLGKKESGRIEPSRLRRGLEQLGRKYICVGGCENHGMWLGKPLQLQIDHKNGEYWDNRPENLQFMCPNCHTQTETWGRKKQCPGGGTADTPS